MNILENFSLKNSNTFGIDAFAQFYAQVSSIEELKEAIHFAKDHQLPMLFLGGGSNVLLTKDFKGLVISVALKGVTEEYFDGHHVLVTAKAGENWHQFVMYCVEQNYGGLENLSLIPGNVGTSPMQNIGAYGVEIKDVFHSCKVLNLETFESEIFSNPDCQFGYRESVFKRALKGKYVILEVTFKLTTQNHKIHTEYGAIQSELAKMNVDQPSLKDVSNAVVAIRQSKLPDPNVIGNAGSFFKNPSIPVVQFNLLKEKFSEIPGYPNSELVKVPAGWLIEHAGWKGKQIGNVASHQLQALVIVNVTGNATGAEVFDFSGEIIQSVKEKYGIELEREVNII